MSARSLEQYILAESPWFDEICHKASSCQRCQEIPSLCQFLASFLPPKVYTDLAVINNVRLVGRTTRESSRAPRGSDSSSCHVSSLSHHSAHCSHRCGPSLDVSLLGPFGLATGSSHKQLEDVAPGDQASIYDQHGSRQMDSILTEGGAVDCFVLCSNLTHVRNSLRS